MTKKSLGNDDYSKAHHSVFNEQRKKQLVYQALAVIHDFLKTKSLKNRNCIDIGCSVGTTSFILAKYFRSVLAIDSDGTAISFAQHTYKRSNLKFSKQDAMQLPYATNSVDVAICQEVYSYLPYPDKLVNEIYRILKPGGICYFVGDNQLFPVESQYKIPFLHYLPDTLSAFFLKSFGHQTYYLGHYKTYWGLKKLLRKFSVHDYTLTILRQPQKYRFVKLYKYRQIVKFLPLQILVTLEYFLPSFVFILEKL